MSMNGVFVEVAPSTYDDLSTDPERVEVLFDGSDGSDGSRGALATLDVDKAWHGLHFLLAGETFETTPGAGEAIMGGNEIGDDFGGYGEARVFAPADVQRIAPLLEWHPERFDPAAMDEVYPGGWGVESDALDWLHDAFTRLKAFYATAAERGSAVVTCLL